MIKVAITGSKGKVGGALVDGLDSSRFEVIQLDLPEHDITDIEKLKSVAGGCDAVVHCAWKELRDWTNLVTTCLEQDIPNNFVLLNAVSKSKENAFDWSNPLGWEPLDSSEGHPNGND